MTETISAKLLFAQAIAEWKRGKYDEAKLLTEKLNEGHFSKDQEAIRLYAQIIFFQIGDHDRAIKVLIAALSQIEHEFILSELCRFYIIQRKFEDVKSITSKYFRHKKLAGTAYINYATSILYSEENLASAAGLYARATVVGNVNHQHETASRMVLSPEAFVELGECFPQCAMNDISFSSLEDQQSDVVFATSGDDSYFRAFFEIYWKSFRATNLNSSIILHFHVFNASDETRELIKEAEIKDSFLRFSFEFVGDNNKKYYYAGRFIQMPSFLRHYKCCIFMTDIDCVYIGAVDEMVNKTRNFDLGIYRYDRYNHPWECFRANMVMFSNSTGGFKFADCVSRFLGWVPDVDLNYWFVDQLALALCYNSNLRIHLGSITSLNPFYNKICFQPTGASGMPEEKAIRARRELETRKIKWQNGA